MEKPADDSPNSWEQPWCRAETLRVLTDLNEQCLELLTEQAREEMSQAPPMFREVADLWPRFDAASRHRAAACPYLLIDAGFADPLRWRWLGGSRVGDREPISYAPFFSAASAGKVARQVFMNAWYIARTEPVGAPLYLGMPAHCVALLSACTIRQVTELADQHASWLRPRWAGRVRVWRELLVAAISGKGVPLEMAHLHGVQLLAMELKAFEQVSARGPRAGPRDT